MEDKDALIMRGELCEKLGITGNTLRRWLREEKLPEPDVAITRRTLGWRKSTLVEAGIRIP